MSLPFFFEGVTGTPFSNLAALVWTAQGLSNHITRSGAAPWTGLIIKFRNMPSGHSVPEIEVALEGLPATFRGTIQQDQHPAISNMSQSLVQGKKKKKT